MAHTLVWWNGSELVSAEYSTFDEAVNQGKSDASRPGGSEMKHVLDQDNIVVAAWTPEVHGVQYLLSKTFLASYATKLRKRQTEQGA